MTGFDRDAFDYLLGSTAKYEVSDEPTRAKLRSIREMMVRQGLEMAEFIDVYSFFGSLPISGKN